MMVTARGLDRAFHRLGAGVGEEHRVREGIVDDTLGEGFALRAAVKVRDVHQRLGLLLDGLGQMRMAVPQDVDRNAAGEIEVFLALLAIEIDPLAPHRPHGRTRVNGHKRRDGHGGSFFGDVKGKRRSMTALPSL